MRCCIGRSSAMQTHVTKSKIHAPEALTDDYQSNTFSRFLLWWRDRLLKVVSGTWRRCAVHLYRQVLLHHMPLSAAIFRTQLPIVYSKIENVHTIDQIVHPAVRAVLGYYQNERVSRFTMTGTCLRALASVQLILYGWPYQRCKGSQRQLHLQGTTGCAGY